MTKLIAIFGYYFINNLKSAMKIIYLKIAAILILACLFYGCSETTESTNANKRYIYYSMSVSDGATSAEAGLYRYDVSSGETVRLANNSVIHVTGVSKDGTIGFEYEGLEKLRWKYNLELGSVPISYPVSFEDNYNYWIYDLPYFTNSYNGNHFVYFVGYRHVETSDKYKDKPKLVILDYLHSSSKIIEIDEISKSFINDTSIDGVQLFNDYILTSNDGKSVWFLMNSFEFSGHDDVGFMAISDFMLLEFNNDKIVPIIKPDYRIKQILGADYPNERILVLIVSLIDSTIFAYNETDSIPVNIPYENFSNPEQFAKEKSEMAGWSDDGIAIYDLTTMTIRQNVISWGRIDSLYPGLAHQKNKRLSFSPDGEYITFALPQINESNKFDLFIVKSDGSEFKRILKNAPVGIPVISSVIE